MYKRLTFLFSQVLGISFLAAAPVVLNPSFEANPGAPWPGYGGVILNWVATPLCGIDPLIAGVPAGDDYSLYGIHSFANNGLVPHGTNVAFIASPWPLGFAGAGAPEARSQISQDISGFESGKRYVVTYYANNRAGGESPFLPANLTVLLEGKVLQGPFQLTPVEALRSRSRIYPRYATQEFTAETSDPKELMFRNENLLNDSTVLLDQIEIVELGNLQLLSARRLFQNHGTVMVKFSAPLDPNSATNTGNYQLGQDIQVSEAVLTSDPKTVRLTTTPLESLQAPFELKVQFILDAQGKGMLGTNSSVPVDLTPVQPAEFGTSTAAFLDDFDSPVRHPNWKVYGPDVYAFRYQQGLLKVGGAPGDSNHLLYATNYDSSVQEVLARVRVPQLSSNGRVGLVVAADPLSGQGMNFVFKAGGMALEADGAPTGPISTTSWQTNTWYWMRLRHQPSLQQGVIDVEGKIWPADGDTPEPAQGLTWDYTPQQTSRNGFAGVTASSQDEPGGMEMDYLVIKAMGLPVIQITPPKPAALYLSLEVRDNVIRVSWPGGEISRGFILEGTNELGESAPWQGLGGSEEIEEMVFEEPMAPGPRFFRLVKP